jgi:hypothetical protein
MAGRAHRSQRLLLHNSEREIVGLFKQFVCHMGLEKLLDPRKRLPTGDDGAAADKGDGLWMDSPCTAWVLLHTNVYGQNVTTRPTGAALCDLGGFSDPGRLGRRYTSPEEPFSPSGRAPERIVLGKPLGFAMAMSLHGCADGVLIDRHQGA